jgi:hypothetical protein
VTIEVVTWRDAYFDTDEPAKIREDYIVRTVGWVREEKLFLAVSAEKLPKGEDPRWRAVTRIPRAMIIKRQKLGKVTPT